MAIIDSLARSKSLQASAKAITKHTGLWCDLFHHTILKIYDLGEERVIGIHAEGRIEGYLSIAMHREWHDTSSSFYKLYRREVIEYVDSETAITDDGIPYTPTKQDLELCKTYFGRDENNNTWRITPERIVLARAMDQMSKEDSIGKNFHYRTAILELYIAHGGIRGTERATKISRKTLVKDIRNIKARINKNGEDTIT